MTARTPSGSKLQNASVVPHHRSVDRRVSEAAAEISRKARTTPDVGIILGSGLGGLADEIDVHSSVSYDEIPGFSRSTALGHAGSLIVGSWCNVPVVVLQGRTHLYEGYRVADVTFPVRVLHALGIRLLVLTSASGGLNPQLSVGDLVVIDNHIDFSGARFDAAAPDASPTPLWNRKPRLYEPALAERVIAVCRKEGFASHRGTYVAVTGPNYETRAEYRMFRALGGDVIGMSTVPEAVVAAGLGLEVLALSAVTNVCNPDRLRVTDGQAVVRAAASTEWKLRVILREILANRDAADALNAL